jgi:hypothetical protein
MRHALRRFGPVLLWQLGTLLLWLGALAIGARMPLAESPPLSLGPFLGLILLIAVTGFLQAASGSLLARSWHGRPPAIAAEFDRLTGFLMTSIPVAACSMMETSAREGFFYAASMFTVLFILFVAGAWIAWSWGYLRPKSDDEPGDVPRGVEAGGLRFIAEPDGDGSDQLGFRVVADDSATMRSVLAAFAGAQLLPHLSGGNRTWLVSIDERPVAVMTQTWEHPRWWPPIEWSADPDESFPADATLRMRLEQATPA